MCKSDFTVSDHLIQIQHLHLYKIRPALHLFHFISKSQSSALMLAIIQPSDYLMYV